MYEQAAVLFLYADSPLHPGAGVSFGAVDLVVQRERATHYPMLQGSGLKGALRHHLVPGTPAAEVNAVFGAGVDAGDQAGAVAFSDARIVLFPVRSLAGTFAYTTSALALARLRRDLETAGFPPRWELPRVPAAGTVHGLRGDLVVRDRVVLESLDLPFVEDPAVRAVGRWLARAALPPGAAFDYFRNRMESHLVVLHDDEFTHFVRHATQVEPHVRIDPETGTAQEKGFFYAENLPADCVLYSLLGLAAPRPPRGGDGEGGSLPEGLRTAAEVGRWLREKLDGRVAQVGADESTGRGLVHLRYLGREEEDE